MKGAGEGDCRDARMTHQEDAYLPRDTAHHRQYAHRCAGLRNGGLRQFEYGIGQRGMGLDDNGTAGDKGRPAGGAATTAASPIIANASPLSNASANARS